MPHFRLLLSTSSLFLFLAAIVAFGLSAFAYRRTVPPIPSAKKYLLIALRSFSIFFLLLLLLEPIFGFLWRENRPPAIAVLVDDSKSMSLQDATGNRAEITRALLKSSGLENLSKVGRIKPFRFATGLNEVSSPDSLSFNGGGTDISTALIKLGKKTVEENIQTAILVTDGNYNLGENPLREAERFGVPIYAVGIGDSSEQKDVLITKVATNEIAYSESRVPMDVMVKSSGFNGDRVEVSLSEGGKPIAQRFLTLKEGTWEYPVKFFFEPKEEGTKRYTVSVSKIEGEVTAANNNKSVFVKVLKSKIKVLLIAGAPSPDVSFIRRALSEDKNVEVKALIQKNAAEFYEGETSSSMIADADCIVLVGFPLPNSRDDVLRTLQAELQQRGKSVFILLSRSVDFNKLRLLDAALPFTSRSARSDEITVSVRVPENERTHPVMKLGGSSNIWESLPPIYRTGTAFQVKPEAEVLGLAKVQGATLNEPLILSRNVVGVKTIAVLGYGIWRWKLLTQATDPSNDVLQAFISNAIRWLTTREDAKQVKIAATKEVFTGGEPVEFVAQAYDKTYRPIDVAEVRVAVKKQNETFETVLTPIGNGRYEGKLDGLGEGEFQFSGTAVSGTERLGEDRGKFSVGAQEIEFQETRMNKPLLQQIAYRSGGKYFDPENISGLADELQRNTKLTSKEITHASEFELWTLPTFLALIILVFGVEWFVRKRIGML